MYWCRAVLLFLQIVAIANCQYQNRRPTVRLPQGTLIGTKVYSDSGKIADTYFGIPYAAPPTNNLRFAPPQRHHGWNGTLHALNYAPQCPQLPFRPGQTSDNEDCLYLNIWAPENALRYGPVPVVIIFEGVEFARSNQIMIPGQDLAMEGVVTITVNYRMNVFGFLSMGSMELRGNYGLIDQYFAMIWVRENIKYFGGDPEKVTLFGYSAGGASVAYHMISPRTSGLFHRIIMSSGSVLSPWHLATNQFKSSEKIIHLLGCQSDYPDTMMQCLRSKRTVDILKAYEEYIDAGNIPEGFIPVIDTFLPESDRYLPFDPVNAFKQGAFPQVPILTGIAQVMTDPQYSHWENIANQGAIQLQQYFEQSLIPEVVTKYQFTEQNREEIIEMIRWRYVSSSSRNTRNLLQQMKAFKKHACQLHIYVYFPN